MGKIVSKTINVYQTEKERKPIKKQVYHLLLLVAVPMIVIFTALLLILFAFNQRYEAALKNVAIASQFNNEFKKTLDAEVLSYAISTRTQELNFSELDNAELILQRLQKTTTHKDNQWRIQSMLNMCKNLRKYMVRITETDSYDSRISQVEININSLTEILTDYMHDYIYDEVRELTRMQQDIKQKLYLTGGVVLAFFCILLVVVLLTALRFTRQLTQPISQLYQKVREMGRGTLSVEPIQTTSVEIKALDDGFNEMVERVQRLHANEVENQKVLHRAQLDLLQAQINPHFLYNTLDSIVWLAETHKEQEVIQMVSSLSVFFRTSLSQGSDIISVAEEQEHIQSYLAIQKIRYGDIMTYEIRFEKSILHYNIPKLILQPIVENAIYHGIKHKRTVGHISIYGFQTKDAVCFTVQDTGVGMDKQTLEGLQQAIHNGASSGIGLSNVHRRIELYCGKGYGVRLASIPGEGTLVSVRVSKNIQQKS